MEKQQQSGALSTLPSPANSGTDIRGIITNIQTYSLHDGPGIRTLIFLKGCPLRCDWCCNPECERPDIEVEFYDAECVRCAACLHSCSRNAINPDLELKSGFKIKKGLCDECGDCIETCPAGALRFIGKVVSVNELMEDILKDRSFYLMSGGGLTVSGGEPLYQIEFARALLKRAFEENIDTAIETCGHVPWRNFEQVLPYLDRVLYDLKHMDPVKHRKATGVSNRLILSNLKKLARGALPIVIRIPLIPQFSLDRDNIVKTAQFISGLKNVVEVNLMPFHQLGKDKYRRLCRVYSLQDLPSLGLEPEGVNQIKEAKDTIESYGLAVSIG